MTENENTSVAKPSVLIQPRLGGSSAGSFWVGCLNVETELACVRT
jgi:hypothetical protein